jgi:hypothetical protein
MDRCKRRMARYGMYLVVISSLVRLADHVHDRRRFGVCFGGKYEGIAQALRLLI